MTNLTTRRRSAAAIMAIVNENTTQPGTMAALRNAKLLIGGYLAVSLITLVVIFLLRNHHSEVNSAVWVRGSIVAASALLTLAFARRAANGSRRAYLRLRIVSAVMVAAIIVIISLPGTFPVWMKVEQGVCGAILLCVVAIVNGKHVRSQFATK